MSTSQFMSCPASSVSGNDHFLCSHLKIGIEMHIFPYKEMSGVVVSQQKPTLLSMPITGYSTSNNTMTKEWPSLCHV